MKKIDILFVVFSACFSFGLGYFLRDKWFLGSITLFFGCLQNLFMRRRLWFEEFAGLAETLVSASVCFFSGLFGSSVFSLLVYVPLAVFSIACWKKNQSGGKVQLNKMTTERAAAVVTLVLVFTSAISAGLAFLPGQNLPVFDAATNILDIAGIVLIALRFKEGWICWFVCEVVELVMWALMIQKGSGNAMMMIVTCSTYLVLYVWGFASFAQATKKQQKMASRLKVA